MISASLTSAMAAGVGVVGAAVALITLVKALMEYIHQGRQKRAEHFFEFRRKLKGECRVSASG